MANPYPIVLVPGLGLGHEAWAPTIAALHGQGLRDVQVCRLPGYGEPAPADDDVSPSALAEVLVQRALAGERTPAVLIGHSASCQVVAHAALLAVPAVRGLVLVGPTTDGRASGWSRLAWRWLRTAVHEPPGQVPALLRQYRQTTLRTMARALDAARKDRLDETLGQLHCPVLVVRGVQDYICPYDWAVTLALPPGRSVARTGGAHLVPVTSADELAATVVGALRQWDGAPGTSG